MYVVNYKLRVVGTPPKAGGDVALASRDGDVKVWFAEEED